MIEVADECLGCSAWCFELCLCRAREERPARPGEDLESARRERLTQAEPEALGER